MGNETNASVSGHYHAVTPTSSASNRAGRKSNRNNLEKDKGKSKRHAGRQQRRDVMRIFLTPLPKLSIYRYSSLSKIEEWVWKVWVYICAVCPCRVGIQTTRVSPRLRRTTAALCLTVHPWAATITTTITIFEAVVEECRVRFHQLNET